MSIRTPYLTLGVLLVSGAFASAQEIGKATISDVSVQAQKSPDFEVGSGIKKVRDNRRDWVQIDVEFSAKSTTRDDFVGNVEVRFYVLPEGAQKDYKKLFSTTINHVDVLKDTPLRSAVYLSPNALARIYGKDKSPNPRDLWVAIEIWIGGKMAGFKITDKESTKWWRRDDVPTDTTMLRPKHKTPFASLWYDSYAEVRE